MTIGNSSPISPFGAIPSVSLANQKVTEGVAFSLRKRFSVLTGATLNIVLDAAAFTRKNLVLLPISFTGFGGPWDINIYDGITDNDDGTPLHPFNRNFIAGGTSQVVFRQNPTGINKGAIVPIELFVPSNGTPAVSSSGSETGDPLVSVLDQSKKVLIECINNDSATSILNIKADFFEVL